MESNNILESLSKLNQILNGRTMKDLLSNVDTQLLPQTTQDAPSAGTATTLGEAAQKYFGESAQNASEKKHKEKKEKKKKKKKDKDKEKDPDRKKKQKTLRYAAGIGVQMLSLIRVGEVWKDQSMDDWPENDFRIFCGNLGNEVSDEMLALAFRRYPSFSRAKVIRDKRTSKTKGYGFVSFVRSEDYIRAMKEMNDQYIGNRPVKLTRSKWKERTLEENKDEIKDASFKKVKTN